MDTAIWFPAAAAVAGAMFGGVVTALVTHWTVRRREKREAAAAVRLVWAELGDHQIRVESLIELDDGGDLFHRWNPGFKAWETNRLALARELSDSQMEAFQRSYALMNVLATLEAERREVDLALGTVREARRIAFAMLNPPGFFGRLRVVRLRRQAGPSPAGKSSAVSASGDATGGSSSS